MHQSVLPQGSRSEPSGSRSSCARPSVAVQMKTLNNLVASCKSRRDATLIDTRRPYTYIPSEMPSLLMRALSPLRIWGTFMNAPYESRDNNIMRFSACPFTRSPTYIFRVIQYPIEVHCLIVTCNALYSMWLFFYIKWQTFFTLTYCVFFLSFFPLNLDEV